MQVSRRSFLKTLSAGIVITVLPKVAFAVPLVDIGNTDVTALSYDIKIIYQPATVCGNDPFGIINWLSWKVHGQDGIQYGGYFEYTNEAMDERLLPKWLEIEIAESMDKIPALNDIRRPTEYQIEQALLIGRA